MTDITADCLAFEAAPAAAGIQEQVAQAPADRAWPRASSLSGAGYGAYHALIASHLVTTDNAYVGASVAQINSQVSGPHRQGRGGRHPDGAQGRCAGGDRSQRCAHHPGARRGRLSAHLAACQPILCPARRRRRHRHGARDRCHAHRRGLRPAREPVGKRRHLARAALQRAQPPPQPPRPIWPRRAKACRPRAELVRGRRRCRPSRDRRGPRRAGKGEAGSVAHRHPRPDRRHRRPAQGAGRPERAAGPDPDDGDAHRPGLCRCQFQGRPAQAGCGWASRSN